VIEALGLIDTVAFDKTGTLTKGSFSVLDRYLSILNRTLIVLRLVVFFSVRFRTDKEEDMDAADDEYDPKKLAASLESKSSHPLAHAIIAGRYTVARRNAAED
jgi:cation transport ATPase